MFQTKSAVFSEQKMILEDLWSFIHTKNIVPQLQQGILSKSAPIFFKENFMCEDK
jgi:hypothetical protein